MQAIQATGETAATIERLYHDYHGAILAHLIRLLGDRETAEDLCHETFIKALRFWNKHDQRSSVSSWLYRIATNTAYDYLRRRRRVRFAPLLDAAEAPSNTPAPDSRWDSEPVRTALAKIPPLYRTPLVLHACGGCSMREIASALGCTDKAIKTRLYRARMRFREVYAED
jgi:RNA polymerase sigma-70 factor (ECF subfamily)